jgi:ribose 5-phosphate isomerase B
MKIAIGSDHLGLELKNTICEFLSQQEKHKVTIVDFGVSDQNPVDYPDIAEKVALDVAVGNSERGILICGTGIGMAISANKVPGVRAAQAHDTYSAERARKSNNAQIITLGSLVIGTELAKKVIKIWLDSDFAGGRSESKVNKMINMDEKYRSL